MVLYVLRISVLFPFLITSLYKRTLATHIVLSIESHDMLIIHPSVRDNTDGCVSPPIAYCDNIYHHTSKRLLFMLEVASLRLYADTVPVGSPHEPS